MKTVAIQEVQDRFDELAHDAEHGEIVTITRDGKPVVDMVAHKLVADVSNERASRFNWEAGQAYLRSRGIVDPVPFISDDFDEPLDEDFLLKPLP